MSANTTGARLRVALLGEVRDQSWDWLGGGTPVETVAVPDVAALRDVSVDLVLASARSEDAVALVTLLTGTAPLTPTALLIGPHPNEHPYARLLEVLTHAKRDWMGTFDAIVDPVLLLDREGALVRANLGFARGIGRDIAGIIGTPYGELLGPVLGAANPVALSLQDGQARTEEVRYERLPGTQQVTTSALRDGSGAQQGLVVIMKNVSDMKIQQERMLQAVRLADIGLLAAGVAHEINTPLASIALRAESLLRSALDPRLQAIDAFKNFPRYLKTIDEEIYRCKKIIGALLEFSRARKPEVREVDLNALTEKAVDLVSHQMRLHQVALALRLEPRLPSIQADDGQLRQALLALLMNALDATPVHGHIALETRRENGERVVLTVADDGVGIPEENRDKIFSPFFTTKPLGEGTGLGLAVCHGIVTAHGGEIRVESAVGQGTRISLVLPVHGLGGGGKRRDPTRPAGV